MRAVPMKMWANKNQQWQGGGYEMKTVRGQTELKLSKRVPDGGVSKMKAVQQGYN